METVGLNTSYDLLLKKTKHSSKPTYTESEINNVIRPVNHIYFVICYKHISPNSASYMNF